MGIATLRKSNLFLVVSLIVVVAVILGITNDPLDALSLYIPILAATLLSNLGWLFLTGRHQQNMIIAHFFWFVIVLTSLITHNFQIISILASR